MALNVTDEQHKRILEQLRLMPDHEKEKLDRILADKLNRIWSPTSGPQLAAYLSTADVLLYGGAAGGGKTDLALGLCLNEHERCLIVRNQKQDLRGFEDRLQALVTTKGWNGILHRWRDPNNPAHIIEVGGLKDAGSEQDWQGNPHDLIIADEAAQLVESRVEFIMGWNRSATGKRCRVLLATNPPSGGDGLWLIEWFRPWLDPLYPNPAAPGELRWAIRVGGESIWVEKPGVYHVKGEPYTAKSYSFIPARLADNPYLKNTSYRSTIEAMPEPLRSQLLYGDFTMSRRDHEKQVIPQSFITMAQKRWRPEGHKNNRMSAIGQDVAFGGTDDAIVQAVYGEWFDTPKVKKGIDVEHSDDLKGMIETERSDNAPVGIDMTGGWGIAVAEALIKNAVKVYKIVFSKGTEKRQTRGGLQYANMRALLWWEFRQDLDPKSGFSIALPPDPVLIAQLMAPRWKVRNKVLYIESKDDIRKRIGSSTDKADAAIIAWYVAKKKFQIDKAEEQKTGNRNAQKPIADPFSGL